jgi:hypothetical protein
MKRRRVLAVVLLAGAFAAGAVAANLIRTSPAEASPTHRYTLHLGDKVAIPAIRQVCAVEAEARKVNLFCQRQRRPRHQVTIFRNNILVWKVGNPEHPAWSGKP